MTKTKSVYTELDNTTLDRFTADISIENRGDTEIIDIANRSLFSGAAGQNFLTCDNFSGDAADQLIAGDLVTFVDNVGNNVNKLVLFATSPVGYGDRRSKSTIYFTTAFDNDVTGKTVQRVRIRSQNSPNESLLYQLPESTIASLESNPDETGINYQVNATFFKRVTGGANRVTITTNKTNEQFLRDINKTVVVITESSDSSLLGKNISVDVNPDVLDPRKLDLLFTSGWTPPSEIAVKIITPIYVTNATAKRKVLKQDVEVTIPLAEAEKSIISLGYADVYNVTQIMMNGKNIIDNYNFDNGQRDNSYELARLTLLQGRPKATSDIVVTLSYFEHTDEGDFFSVDSYTHDDGVGYTGVPFHTPSSAVSNGTEFSGNGIIRLSDYIDFRPIVNTIGPDASKLASVTDGVDEQSSTSFNNSVNSGNGFSPRLPVPGSFFECDIEHYLPRVDSLFLENTGALNLVQGVSSESPQRPEDLTTAIRLYDLIIPAYTFSAKDIDVKKYNYPGYQMKDIAEIERRVERVEELVTLSLLEQSTLNMSVRDAVTGLDRFKNGIIVDNFSDHSRGETGTDQYRNSIDPNYTHLRPGHFTDQVEMEEVNQTDNQRTNDGYKQESGIVTLDYTTRLFMQNPLATRFINLQPYSVFTYDGNLVLTPSIDTWTDTKRLPDLVIKDNSLYDAVKNQNEALNRSGIGTVWGDWNHTSTSKKSKHQVLRTGERNRTVSDEEYDRIRDQLIVQGIPIGISAKSFEQYEKIRKRVESGGRQAIKISTTTTSEKYARKQTTTTFKTETARIQNTSYGDRVVDVALAKRMRSVPVRIQAYRLKPNTRYYLYFDDVDCSDWMSIDTMSRNFPDRKKRYRGRPNQYRKGFGFPIVSDDVGTVTGLFLIPNGRAPKAGTKFTKLGSVKYKTSGPTRSFTTGTKTIRLTSHPDNHQDLSQLKGMQRRTLYPVVSFKTSRRQLSPLESQEPRPRTKVTAY